MRENLTTVAFVLMQRDQGSISCRIRSIIDSTKLTNTLCGFFLYFLSSRDNVLSNQNIVLDKNPNPFLIQFHKLSA